MLQKTQVLVVSHYMCMSLEDTDLAQGRDGSMQIHLTHLAYMQQSSQQRISVC